jgi:Ca-activated chloride channel family protein
MNSRMKLRSVILLLISIALLWAVASGQNAGNEDNLPSAPSAVKHPKPVPPPPAQPAAQSSPSADSTKSTAPKSDQPAAGNASQLGPAAATDQAPPAGSDVTATIHKTVNEVNVVFTVTDKHGHYVRNLKKENFKVIDDNRPADEIRSFHNETDLPLRVGLLVDASNSVRDRFKFEQESASAFLNQTIRPKYDQAFVVGFDVTPEVTQDFTDNAELLGRGVRELRPGGGTAMFDAVYFACRDKLLNVPQTGPLRKAIILLSDGDDNQSHVTREEAIEMAQRAGVIIYTISTNVMGGDQRGDKILQRIADATGGRAFLPFQLTDVANAFAQIQDELRSQYAISWKPSDFVADGRYRTIEILADQKNLRVRSRHGYYAGAQ